MIFIMVLVIDLIIGANHFSLSEEPFTRAGGSSEWTFKNLLSNQIFQICGGYNFIGGYKTFGKDTIAIFNLSEPLPSHYRLRFSVKLIKIDQ